MWYRTRRRLPKGVALPSAPSSSRAHEATGQERSGPYADQPRRKGHLLHRHRSSGAHKRSATSRRRTCWWHSDTALLARIGPREAAFTRKQPRPRVLSPLRRTTGRALNHPGPNGDRRPTRPAPARYRPGVLGGCLTGTGPHDDITRSRSVTRSSTRPDRLPDRDSGPVLGTAARQGVFTLGRRPAKQAVVRPVAGTSLSRVGRRGSPAPAPAPV
jgi:hypothetical protein